MFLSTFVENSQDIKRCKLASGVKEVLLGAELLCRESKLTLADCLALAKEAKAADLEPVLVWDILMPETVLEEVIQELAGLDLSAFSAIRVQDIGALNWLMETKPQVSIQFIAETGNANLAGLKRWEQVIGAELTRIVLSPQLPEEKLCTFIKELATPCEVLGAGPILLFYSPRPLLTPKIDIEDGASDWLYAVSSSEESHHREFPTIENRHGTFMYLNKDQFILDKLSNLKEAGLAAVRIDLRQIAEGGSATGIEALSAAISDGTVSAKEHWGKPAFAPFFRKNNTTKQFKKLKPQIHELRDERCIGRVLMGKKPNQMVLWALRDFTPGERYTLALPDGSEVSCSDLTFRNMHGENLTECREDQLLITSWVKKCCSGALLLAG